MVDGDIQAAANKRRQRARGPGRGAGVVGKGRIEAMYDADQTLGERGIAVKARGGSK